MAAKPNSYWLVPLSLLALGGLNILSGAFQLDTIIQGPPEVPDKFTSMHYFATPIPIVLHIISGIFFNLLGPFQFAPRIRLGWPGWHRWSGRLWVTSGLFVALTGFWMNEFFPVFGGSMKYFGVMAHCFGLILSLAMAMNAILGRNVQQHRAWMMRAFAIGLGPATQRLFILPVFFINGNVSELIVGLVVWGSLLLNLFVVEWSLLKGRREETRKISIKLKEA